MQVREEVNVQLPSIQDNYDRISKKFEDSFDGNFQALSSHGILVRGEPGSGKSFIIVFWTIKYVEANMKVLIMVPFRRLVYQMRELFVLLGTDPTIIATVEGKCPIFGNLRTNSIIICTYEHAYNIKMVIGDSAIVIDEVHNLFYPERGWQLDPFLTTNRILLCTGTISEFEFEGLAKKIAFLTKKAVEKLTIKNTFPRLTQQLDIKDFESNQEEILQKGGAFYFFPTKTALIQAAYKYSKEYRMPLINPLTDEELLSFSPLMASLLKPREVLDFKEEFINFKRTPVIYIDFSSHFDSEIRAILSKDKSCKINVFCTTTLCEGLNLLSLKAAIIANGLWDWRRVKQIEGRAGRFLELTPIYKGRIANKKSEPLVLDLLDQIALDLRTGFNGLIFYKRVDLVEMNISEEAYHSLLGFLKTQGCYSVQNWLQKNLGISLNIKYSSFQKVINRKRGLNKNLSIQVALDVHVGEPLYQNYLTFFVPVLKVDYLDLCYLPEDDEE